MFYPFILSKIEQESEGKILPFPLFLSAIFFTLEQAKVVNNEIFINLVQRRCAGYSSPD